MSFLFTLAQLGWRAHFSQQLSLQDLERFVPARVSNVQRSGITVLSERGEHHVAAGVVADSTIAVGDWVLCGPEMIRIERVLERTSFLSRIAAGSEHRVQAIAANIDTLFVVTSCNDDFNASRLERYLAVARDAQIEAVVVLTKRDLCEDVDALLRTIFEISSSTTAIAVNALDDASTRSLMDWLSPGCTVAFVGSSGVGKSTLVNTLTGAQQATSDIREHDAKGRHTTTSRHMIAMPSGAWLIDTPGMRELKLGAVEAGIRATFDDIALLAQQCRFRDCRHEGEKDCAVAAAIASGLVSERRLANYLKLQREASRATQSLAQRREKERHFGKMHKRLQEQHRREKGR